MQFMYWSKFYPFYIELIRVDYFGYGNPKKRFDKQIFSMGLHLCANVIWKF
jgi:hypothetical protein